MRACLSSCRLHLLSLRASDDGLSAIPAGRPVRRRYQAEPAKRLNSAWRLRLMRTTRWSTRCLRTVRFREILARCVMRRKIGTAIVSLLLLSGSSSMCFAQTGDSPSAGQKGVAGSPKAEGIGSTSSTHNPNPSSMRLEWKTEREPKWAMMRQHTIRWAKRTEPLPCVFQARKPSGSRRC